MSKQGSSLIETMVAMVLLLIICLSSAYFFAIPPFRKEALRFAALERAAGVFDMAIPIRKLGALGDDGYYRIDDFPLGGGASEIYNTASMAAVANKFYFSDQLNSNRMPSVWYTLRVTVPAVGEVIPRDASMMRRAELKLYDKQGDTNSLFATFKMLLPPAGP